MLKHKRLSASLGASSFGTILTSAAILLALVAVVACQSRGSRVLPQPPPDSLAGDWDFTSTTSTNTCNLGSNVQPFQSSLYIVEGGDILRHKCGVLSGVVHFLRHRFDRWRPGYSGKKGNNPLELHLLLADR